MSKRPKELDDADRMAYASNSSVGGAVRDDDGNVVGSWRVFSPSAIAAPRPIPRRFEFPWMPIFAGLIFVLSIVLCTTGAVTWFRWIAAAIR